MKSSGLSSQAWIATIRWCSAVLQILQRVVEFLCRSGPIFAGMLYSVRCSVEQSSAGDCLNRICSWGQMGSESNCSLESWLNACFAVPPVVTSPELLLRGLVGRPTLFLGDGAVSFRDRILQAMPGEARFAEPVAPSLAGAVARLAAVQTVLPPPHEIRPLYVRRPDAELLRERQV